MTGRYLLDRNGRSKRRRWVINAMSASYMAWTERYWKKYLAVHELFCLSEEE